MTAGRWEQIERLYQEASARPPSERKAFLDNACAGDADLRGEVERMLSGEAVIGSFLETPAAALAAGERLSPGARIGPYEVVSFLGAGGNGEVYQQRRTRLNRPVPGKALTGDAAGAAHPRKRQ